MPAAKRPARAQAFDLPRRIVAETGRHVPGQQAYLEAVRTADHLRAASAALFARHGLSGKQYNVLRTVRRAGAAGASAADIQAELVESGPDVSRLVDRLVRAGLVVRRRSEEDRRAVRVLLSAQGAKLLKTLDEPLVQLHVAQFQRLSKAEIGTLVKLLRKARGEAPSG
jgi:DNA-binding MarR family transcriptional regulator